MRFSRRRFLATSACATVGLQTLSAAPLPQPTGTVLLEVSGAIAMTNRQDSAVFDRTMLKAIDWTEVQTFTSFTEGPQRLAGPRLTSVLAAVGAQGNTLHATAINDYSVRIPIAHADQHDVILAMDMNGAPMRVRDKGPIWVVYPLSKHAAEKRPFDDQMIWQLVRLRVD